MKRYDSAYFARWYEDRGSLIGRPAALQRKVHVAVSVAEYLLERRIRSVLDVGCGMGAWLAALRRLRPGIAYTGVDASDWAVRRYGRRRNIHQGRFGDMDRLGLGGPFDLIVCADVLHYVSASELARGLPALVRLLRGVAFLETYTSADSIEGDLDGWRARPPSFYRRRFVEAGLIPCGLHCWASDALAWNVAALERPGGG